MWIFTIALIIFVRASNVAPNYGNPDWSHQLDLDNEHGISFKWKNVPEIPQISNQNEGNQWLIVEVTARTKGYIGVGWSPHGGMEGADIVIGWIDDGGQPHLIDFYGTHNGMPIQDESQDYQLVDASKTENTTTITFKRLWDTCDGKDMPMINDTMRLIWAFSPKDPIIKNPQELKFEWHGSKTRGTKSVFMIDIPLASAFPDQPGHEDPSVKYWDMTMNNNTVEAEHTTYFCKIVKFPQVERKHHLIGYRPILFPKTKSRIHHITMYECMIPAEYGGTQAVFEAHTAHSGGRCYTKTMPPEWSTHCVTFLMVWLAGSEGEMLPAHVGVPLGEEHNGATYFMFEIHYDNPDLETFVDSSGIRIYYTDKLREHDGSVMLAGYRITPFLLLPPRQANFVTYGICSAECTEKTIPSDGIKIFNTLLHAHLSAKKLRFRHFRNGVELPLIAEDNNYDFNYQQSRTLKQEVTILPGDELLTECEYDTRNKDRLVLGGLATTQEMCQAFFIYYPRIDLMQCTSQYEFHDFFNGLGIDNVTGSVLKALRMPYNPDNEQKFDPPDDAKELEEEEDGDGFRSVFDKIDIQPKRENLSSVGQHLQAIDWLNQKYAKSVEKHWKNGKHYAYCTGHGRKRVPLKNHVISFPNIKEPLEKAGSRQCSSGT